MIVFRYLFREVVTTLTVVSGVLLVIIMSGRFIRFLAQAASGAMDPSIVLMIMGYRIPGFLQLILPLGLFLGILLSYGRLYLESEMTVLTATGMSQQKLFCYTLAPAVFLAAIVAFLALYLSPLGGTRVEQLLFQQDKMTEFDTLSPGRFQSIGDGSRVTYAESLSEDRNQLQNIFISERRNAIGGKKDAGISLLVAKYGHQEIREDGQRYLILNDGYRYDGKPGEADYRIIKYETYGVLLPSPTGEFENDEVEAIATQELIKSDDPKMKIELYWRLSLILLVFIVTMLAVPLAKVNPRQGRFLKLLPAIFLYMTYLGLLIASRGALDKGKLALSLAFWPVHSVFLLLAVLLLYWDNLVLKLAQWRRPSKGQQHA
ncbi:LPS export ABC transporter permease LptF [Pseudomonas sp. F1_0610]|uniref:LPS export ABC transporter permease LptF n=1 Tax=Pseudomonas sp. F1_0610 TaxID=3114284 RepID=UPI0039C3895F